MAPVLTLMSTTLKGWMSAKGFWLVVGAALFPLALTGAWVGTHQSDIAAIAVSSDKASFVEGESVNFTAEFRNVGNLDAGRFNNTLAVLRYQGGALTSEAFGGTSKTEPVESLPAGGSTRLNLTWTAVPGVYLVIARADPNNDIGELEEFNNTAVLNLNATTEPTPFMVAYKLPLPADAPEVPGNLTGTGASGATVDAAVESLTWSPAQPQTGDDVRVTATVANRGAQPLTNATVTVRAGRVFEHQLIAGPRSTQAENVTLAPGQSQQVTLVWPSQEGGFWAEASVNVNEDRDADGANNHQASPFTVNPAVPAELVTGIRDFLRPHVAPPAKATIKEFYLGILLQIHLIFIIPLVALFYAGGVIADEKEAGNLPYLLTRPMRRWAIPLAKFAAGYGVALVALLVGLVGAFALLFGTPGGRDVGFLTTPLLATVLALFAYGAFFVLLGTLAARPYLVGVGFVLGWEFLANRFVPWVKQFTISQHVIDFIQAWPLDKGFLWLPETEAGVRGMLLVVAAALAFLGGSAYVMMRREFDT